MSDFMLGTDKYWYKIAKNPFKRSACMPCENGKFYTVFLDKYIEVNNGNLYKLMNENRNGGITITGKDGMSYYVENKQKSAKNVYSSDHLNDFICEKPKTSQQPTQQRRPTPKISFPNGDGSADCNDHGVCEVNAPKGTKISVKRPKGYKVKTDGKLYWLDKE